MRLLAVAVFAIVVMAAPALGGINVWTSHGPEGGSVEALAINPSTPIGTATNAATVVSSATRTSTAGGTATPTALPALTSTPTPATTATPPCDGSGHDKLCRGGNKQGDPCGSDGDCGDGAICERHGHSRTYLEQCNVSYNMPEGWAPLGGLAGDTIADQVSAGGGCSTEDNAGLMQGVPNYIVTGSLAYDPINDLLCAGSDFQSVVKCWTGAAKVTSDATPTVFLGQKTQYATRWDRIPGDHNADGGVGTNYTFTQGSQIVAFEPSTTTRPGALWAADTGQWVKRFDAPIVTDGRASTFLCSTTAFGTSTQSCKPTGVAIGSRGQIAISSVHGVQIWNNYPNSSGQLPDVVLGQASVDAGIGNRGTCNQGTTPTAYTLCWPAGVAFLSGDILAVVDSGNNRVMIYTPDENGRFHQGSCSGRTYQGCDNDSQCTGVGTCLLIGQSAKIVLGQASSTARVLPDTPSATNTRLTYGIGNAANIQLAASGTALAVPDTFFNRVMIWDNAATVTTGAAASRVIGMSSFTSTGTLSKSQSLSQPYGAAIGGGYIWVADWLNHRVTVYTWPVPTSGATAIAALGQPTTATTYETKVNQWKISPGNDSGLVLDSRGGLIVGDFSANRLLYWSDYHNAHLGLAPTAVIGQGTGPNDWLPNGGTGAPSASVFNGPRGLAMDSSTHDLYVADSQNHRILRFANFPDGGTSAVSVIGQVTMNSGAENASGLGHGGLLYPRLISVDANGALWVTDSGNHRVLRYSSPASSSAMPDFVLGQPDFTSQNSGCMVPTATSLCRPDAVIHDVANKHIFVSDQSGMFGMSRVLMYYYSSVGTLTSGSNGLAATAALGAQDRHSWSTCPTRLMFCCQDATHCQSPQVQCGTNADCTTAPFNTCTQTGQVQYCRNGGNAWELPARTCSSNADCTNAPYTSCWTIADAQRDGCTMTGIALHPTNGNLFVIEPPRVIEYVPPFFTHMPAYRMFGGNQPFWWMARGEGSGYISCQWNAAHGIQIHPTTHDMWVVDSAEAQRVLTVFDPDGATPTPTWAYNTATVTVTPTVTATWTNRLTMTPTYTPPPTSSGGGCQINAEHHGKSIWLLSMPALVLLWLRRHSR